MLGRHVGHVVGRHVEPRAEQHRSGDGLAGWLVNETDGKLAAVAVLHIDLERLELVVGGGGQGLCRTKGKREGYKACAK